jgi:hypothetical protein
MRVANVAGLAGLKLVEFIGFKPITSPRHVAPLSFDKSCEAPS